MFNFGICKTFLISLPGFPTVQFLISCSMQKRLQEIKNWTVGRPGNEAKTFCCCSCYYLLHIVMQQFKLEPMHDNSHFPSFDVIFVSTAGHQTRECVTKYVVCGVFVVGEYRFSATKQATRDTLRTGYLL